MRKQSKLKSVLIITGTALATSVAIITSLAAITVGAIVSVDASVITKPLVAHCNAKIEIATISGAVDLPITCDDINHLFHVVIDAGHGGFDGGVQGLAGTRESELALEISHKIREEIEGRGIRVTMTRKDDERLHDENARHKQRSDILNRHKIIDSVNPDLVISIHLNSFPGNRSVSGLQVFYQENAQTGKNFAHAIQTHLNKTELFRGIASRGKDSRPGDYLILETEYPSVLIECGFLSNPDEEQKLVTSEYQTLLATHIADAVVETLEAGNNYFFS
ncbi:MAG: N-acetylmuramoyl-L-alanine amidase [Firmicutes bacterium]|nr:N-acetylmuramoyl-L-alanine amidase [Bacillota bacterium]